MADKDLQKKIIQILKRSEGALSSTQIYERISGEKPASRTFSRLLSKLVETKQIVRSGKLKTTRYAAPQIETSFLIPEKISPQQIPNQSAFSGYKIYLKQYFESREKTPIFYDKNRLESYMPNSSYLLPENIIKSLKKSPDPTLMKGETYADKVIATFLKQFTFNSSRLEGAVKNLASTEEIIESGDTSDEKRLIVVNHHRAAQWLIKCALNREYGLHEELEIGAKPIQELHMILMDGLIRGDNEGLVRNDSVKISGTSYIPLSLKEDLTYSLNLIAIKGSKIKNPNEKSFFFFLFIAYLQAFWDGNKRTGRLFSNLPLLSEGLAPNSFHQMNEEEYLMALIYYYETGDQRPIALLWTESYILGMELFVKFEQQYNEVNQLKVQMEPDRAEIVHKIVTNSLGEIHLKKIAQDTWGKSKNNHKYQVEQLLSQVKTDLAKLASTGLGYRKYNLTPETVEKWAKTWKQGKN